MKKSLALTNPYLQNQTLKKKMIRRFVTSSSAIEGIHITPSKKSVTTKKVIRTKAVSRKAKGTHTTPSKKRTAINKRTSKATRTKTTSRKVRRSSR